MTARYDPFRHHRKSIRYADWDYRTPGYYFITICTVGRTLLFNNQEFKQVADTFWRKIPTQKTASHVQLDAFVVMPNHVHLILHLFDYPSGYTEQAAPRAFRAPPPGSIGALVGQYKSTVTRAINNLRKSKGAPVWQRGYWDRIIRNEAELNKTRQYIIDNPARWAEDGENLDAVLNRMIFHE